MAQIIWTATAADDLSEIADFIAADKPDAATKLVRQVLDSVERLSDFPHHGRIVPEFQSERYRELVVFPCRVIYRAAIDSVVILRIIRGERQLRRQMLSEN